MANDDECTTIVGICGSGSIQRFKEDAGLIVDDEDKSRTCLHIMKTHARYPIIIEVSPDMLMGAHRNHLYPVICGGLTGFNKRHR
jgi:hypothetical protein